MPGYHHVTGFRREARLGGGRLLLSAVRKIAIEARQMLGEAGLGAMKIDPEPRQPGGEFCRREQSALREGSARRDRFSDEKGIAIVARVSARSAARCAGRRCRQGWIAFGFRSAYEGRTCPGLITIGPSRRLWQQAPFCIMRSRTVGQAEGRSPASSREPCVIPV
jgi:hypothetical protein